MSHLNEALMFHKLPLSKLFTASED